jgi:hypothetical protein
MASYINFSVPGASMQIVEGKDVGVRVGPFPLEHVSTLFPPSGQNRAFFELVLDMMERTHLDEFTYFFILEAPTVDVTPAESIWTPVTWGPLPRTFDIKTEDMWNVNAYPPMSTYGAPTVQDLYDAPIEPRFLPMSKFFRVRLGLQKVLRSTSSFTRAHFEACLREARAREANTEKAKKERAEVEARFKDLVDRSNATPPPMAWDHSLAAWANITANPLSWVDTIARIKPSIEAVCRNLNERCEFFEALECAFSANTDRARESVKAYSDAHDAQRTRERDAKAKHEEGLVQQYATDDKITLAPYDAHKDLPIFDPIEIKGTGYGCDDGYVNTAVYKLPINTPLRIRVPSTRWIEGTGRGIWVGTIRDDINQEEAGQDCMLLQVRTGQEGTVSLDYVVGATNTTANTSTVAVEERKPEEAQAQEAPILLTALDRAIWDATVVPTPCAPHVCEPSFAPASKRIRSVTVLDDGRIKLVVRGTYTLDPTLVPGSTVRIIVPGSPYDMGGDAVMNRTTTDLLSFGDGLSVSSFLTEVVNATGGETFVDYGVFRSA